MYGNKHEKKYFPTDLPLDGHQLSYHLPIEKGGLSYK